MNKNQCIGCIRNLPIVSGIHYGGDYDYVACTESSYEKDEE